MSEMFNEVDEELRQEKIQQFWQDNKYFIIGGIISAILFTAGFGYWKDWKRTSYMNETTRFYNALNTTKIENLVTYSNTAKDNHAALAKLSAASLYMNKNETTQAIALLKEIQTNRNIDKLYRDLAVLIEATQSLDTADEKTLSYLEKKLIPLTGKRSAWNLSAQEALALIAAKQRNFKKAVAVIDKLLQDSSITKGMRTRVSELRILYIAQQAKEAPKENN